MLCRKGINHENKKHAFVRVRSLVARCGSGSSPKSRGDYSNHQFCPQRPGSALGQEGGRRRNFRPLPALQVPRLSHTRPGDINNHSVIVGSFTLAFDGPSHPFMVRNGVFTEIRLPGFPTQMQLPLASMTWRYYRGHHRQWRCPELFTASGKGDAHLFPWRSRRHIC
jgi:hypothetical protein